MSERDVTLGTIPGDARYDSCARIFARLTSISTIESIEEPEKGMKRRRRAVAGS